jgi:hypothetical protein
MSSDFTVVDASVAMGYVGKTVLVEQVWADDPEPLWSVIQIVGVVLPYQGTYPHGHFLVAPQGRNDKYPDEVFFSDIRTIRVMRHRDRQSSGNVLDRIAHPNLNGSRAALPARRNSFFVTSNGSTGAAHP